MSAKSQAAIAAVSIATLMCVGTARADPSDRTGTTGQARPSAASTAPSVTYRSVFEGYRGYSVQPVGSWRRANDTVGEIGGWRAYARESEADERDAADADTRPAMRRDSGGNGHTGHH
jgi:hypothetical protein